MQKVKKMNKFELMETDEYEVLVKFFVENQLEFDGDEEVDTDIIKCFKIMDEEGGLAGGAVLAEREGKYIIDGIAVDEKYRMNKLGKQLLDRVVEEVKALDGDSLYLVARAPGFFRRNGFEPVSEEVAPNFFECKYCPQYKVSCHPEIMKLEIR